jgi:hypothetical protein
MSALAVQRPWRPRFKPDRMGKVDGRKTHILDTRDKPKQRLANVTSYPIDFVARTCNVLDDTGSRSQTLKTKRSAVEILRLSFASGIEDSNNRVSKNERLIRDDSKGIALPPTGMGKSTEC